MNLIKRHRASAIGGFVCAGIFFALIITLFFVMLVCQTFFSTFLIFFEKIFFYGEFQSEKRSFYSP